MQTLIDFINQLFDRLMSVLLCPVKYFFYYISQLTSDFINSIDVSSLNSAFQSISISPDLAYYLDYLAFKESFLIMSSAATIRFTIRRIPFFN